MDNALLMDDKNQQNLVDDDYETELTEESEEEQAPKKNIRERAIDFLENRYQTQIEQLETDAATQKEALEQKYAGKEKEIEILTQKEKARADMEAYLAKKDEEIVNSKFSVDSINSNYKNSIERKNRLIKRQLSCKARKEEVETDITKDINIIETETQKINLLEKGGIDNLSDENKKELSKAKDKLKDAQEDLMSKSQEAAELPSKIEELANEIQAALVETQNFQQQLQEAKAEHERLQIEQKTNKAAFEQMKKQDKKGEPKWYKDYVKAKNKYDKTSNDLASAIKNKAEVSDNVNNMELVQITGKDGSVSEALYNASGEGEAFFENDDAKEQLAVIKEEAKVENGLKNAEIIKEVNKDTIANFLNYNPDTGGQYEEGEKRKSSNLLVNNIENLLTKENIEIVKNLATKLKGNDTVKKIDDFITTSICDHPLNSILEKIEGTDFLAMKEFILDKINIFTSPEFRKEHPIQYEILNSIFSALGNFINFGDKGDLSSSKAIDESLGNMAYVKYGEFAGTVISTISGMLDWKTILANAGTMTIKGLVKNNRVTKGLSHIVDSGKSLLGAGEEMIKSSRLASETDRFREQGNERYARIIAGASRAARSKSFQNITNAAASGVKGASTLILGKGLGTLPNLAISAVGMGINKIINWGFGKADKSDVLNSSAVLGNVKYDTSLVKEDKFNEILKRVSGITSKDKLYGAIKTVDAISLHASMRKSMAEPDHTTDRVMADLGFQNRVLYPQISIQDIMSKTGYEPAGGDWRQELKDSLLVENEDYETIMGSIWNTTKTWAKKAWASFKDSLPFLSKKTDDFLDNKSKKLAIA